MTATPADTLRELTRVVLVHRRGLLGDYQPQDLHQFRVHIRRIRALMKWVPCLHNRGLRAGWRELFIVTNPARDWDVFLASAYELLPPASARALGRHMNAPMVHEHGRVRHMLRGHAWSGHLHGWNQFVDSLKAPSWSLPPELLPELETAAERTRVQALTEEDRAAWHRYRIATKNLRYVAELAGPNDSDLATPSALIESCKRIQDLLGAWHDCTVQLELLADPALIGATAAVRKKLSGLLVARRDQLLREARQVRIKSPGSE